MFQGVVLHEGGVRGNTEQAVIVEQNGFILFGLLKSMGPAASALTPAESH
jgi:hypothetical protein